MSTEATAFFHHSRDQAVTGGDGSGGGSVGGQLFLFLVGSGIARCTSAVTSGGVGEDANYGAVNEQVATRASIAEPYNIPRAGLVRAEAP